MAKIHIDSFQGTVIGLLADSHSREKGGADLPQAVLDAFRGVDLIVHLGDMGMVGSLDRLADVAPVLALRGAHAVGRHPRLAKGTRRLESERAVVGAVFDLPGCADTIRTGDGLELDEARSPGQLDAAFGGPVNVVAYAKTHLPCIQRSCGILFVNPGSPTLPAAGDGTVAIVDLSGEQPEARIVTLPPGQAAPS